ncbi:MarR family winged helix-turn-helix transcriptional regulator [Paenibacillus thailandensis]|uniref:MarR family winged helix-turn-helix transcriptional regulator n=1 Tax=Paenibacillus thailandensis TaxID=393250 RepID=A0ABW5QSD7_9BACL
MTRNFGLLNKSCCSVGANEISLVQSHILYEIDRQHNPSVQQIADILGMDITTLSRQIQTLAKKKLVRKSPLPEDKRVYILSLTTEGKFVAGSIDHMLNDYLEKVFSLMNDFERDTVLRSLKLLNDSIMKAKTLYPLRC